MIRKQTQFGTELELVATPAVRVNALSNPAVNMANVADPRPKQLAAIRGTAHQATANPIPIKRAKKPHFSKKHCNSLKVSPYLSAKWILLDE